MLGLATFRVDCTPPAGCSTGFGTGDPVKGTRDPLYLRGYVLEAGESRCLIACMDYCALMNSAHDQMRSALAEAVGTTADRVAVHCIHQHDAPIIDFEIDGILGCRTYPRAWWDDLVQRCARAATESLERTIEIGAVGHAETRLWGYASNRRILGPDGRVRGMRFSRCPDPSLTAEPVGTIDPMLRTLAFRDARGRLAADLSFYATHPQVSHGRGLYSADAPGEAMRILSDESEGLHGFLTGAGGNVTAGKYSSTTDLEGNLKGFGRRLAAGISRNLRSLEWESVDGFEWSSASFDFPVWRERVARAEADAADESLGDTARVCAATVASAAGYPGNERYTLHFLRLGAAGVLFLGGEPFVEYQLTAQAATPDRFVAVAGNCGDGFLYLPIERSYAEGGYEVESFAWCTGDFEGLFHVALSRLPALTAAAAPPAPPSPPVSAG